MCLGDTPLPPSGPLSEPLGASTQRSGHRPSLSPGHEEEPFPSLENAQKGLSSLQTCAGGVHGGA